MNSFDSIRCMRLLQAFANLCCCLSQERCRFLDVGCKIVDFAKNGDKNARFTAHAKRGAKFCLSFSSTTLSFRHARHNFVQQDVICRALQFLRHLIFRQKSTKGEEKPYSRQLYHFGLCHSLLSIVKTFLKQHSWGQNQ